MPVKPVVFRNVQHFSNGRWEHVNLVVARGRIACLQSEPQRSPCGTDFPVGQMTDSKVCPTSLRAQALGSLSVDWPDVCVLPGLINAHDHLDLDLLPRLGRGPYPNSYRWSEAIYRPNESPMVEVLAIPLRDRLLMGAYRNLLAGVTTVCHHNPYHRRAFGRLCPVSVLKPCKWAHSLGFGEGLERSFRQAGGRTPWIIHAAEGTDEVAEAEIATLAARGLLARNTVIVHGVGMDERDIALLEQRGSSLIWCPSSNLFLFGATARVDGYLDRIPVALGSDSTLTAEGDLLDELRVAATCDLWPRHRLIELVTSLPARILRIHDGRGGITCGAPADLLFVPAGAANPSEALLATDSRDIRLVLRGGSPGYGDLCAQPIFDANLRRASRVSVDGRTKLVAGRFAELVERVSHALGPRRFFGHEITPAPA